MSNRAAWAGMPAASGARLPREVDFSALPPTRTIVRRGLRAVIFGVVGITIVSGLWLSGAAADSNVIVPVGLLIALTCDFMVPAFAYRSRIRKAKNEELERVSERIRVERERVMEAPSGGADSPLANLVAYRSLVADAPEWAFSASGLLRIAAMMALGLLSWFGAALVERFIDRVM